MNHDNPFHQDNYFEKDRDVKSELIYGSREKIVDCSIMIPTFRRPQYLTRTIESVLRQKSKYSFEIVVVDNNDDFDDTEVEMLIRNFSTEQLAYYRNQTNLGMAGNFNRCLLLASAPWVLILADDDVIDENYIEQMMGVAVKYSDADLIACRMRCIDQFGKDIIKNKIVNAVKSNFSSGKVNLVSKRQLYLKNPALITGALIKKESAINLGGFSRNVNGVFDYVFIYNLIQNRKVYVYNKILISYRISSNSSFRPDILRDFPYIQYEGRLRMQKAFHLWPSVFHMWFVQASLFNAECENVKAWGRDENSTNAIICEYDSMNSLLKVSSPSRLSLFIHKIFRCAYSFYQWFIWGRAFL